MPPVTLDQVIDVDITERGNKGSGVARIDNFVIFVEECDVGDRVKIRITKMARTWACGVIIETLPRI